MCDTIGYLSDGRAYFAKNSDRSPNEPQVLEWHPPRTHEARTVKTTYIEVEQAPRTYGVLLSRPVWLWGGEMGVNEHGVCIGNEAVFTLGRYAKTGLTGMDLVRLALERACTAREATDVLIELLMRYGQGGNCGYDHAFYYDNSFLILDRSELFVLETAGKHWVVKRAERARISNRLSVQDEGARYSTGKPYRFAARHSEPVYTCFSGSRRRSSMTGHSLESASSAADLIRALRMHAPSVQNPLAQGSVTSPCMHAGGLVGDHTTASLVVELGQRTRVYATGCSTPCLALFKPAAFGAANGPVFEPDDPGAEAYWRKREAFVRRCIGRTLPADYFHARDALEAEWLSAAQASDGADAAGLACRAMEQERAFYAGWEPESFPSAKAGARFMRYWRDKTAVFERESGS